MAEGRPTVMTPEVLQKLKDAFLVDASDEQACNEAGIAPATLYNYQKENPSYLEKKKLWKEDHKYQAKNVIFKAIKQGDVDTAKWVAERKMKEDFSTRSEVTGKDGSPLISYEQFLGNKTIPPADNPEVQS